MRPLGGVPASAVSVAVAFVAVADPAGAHGRCRPCCGGSRFRAGRTGGRRLRRRGAALVCAHHRRTYRAAGRAARARVIFAGNRPPNGQPNCKRSHCRVAASIDSSADGPWWTEHRLRYGRAVRAIRRFTVRTVLPPRLAALGDLVTNLRWSWHAETLDLLESIDPQTWRAVDGDPGRLLGLVPHSRFAELSTDEQFLGRLDEAAENLRQYLTQDRWFQTLGDEAPKAIAYFSPEYGITAVLPQYSGGLGILAGDHLKTASDLGVPVIGVGLLYRRGYFNQSLVARRLAARALPTGRPARVAADAVDRGRRLAGDGPGAAARPRPAGSSLAVPGRPHPVAAAGLRRRGQCASRARRHRPPLRRRHRSPLPPGIAARRRWDQGGACVLPADRARRSPRSTT